MESKIIQNNLNKNEYYESLVLNSNEITTDSFCYLVQDNTFIEFRSLNDILYLVYSNEKKFIIIFNLIEFKKESTIKNAHNKYITNFRYYLDEINIRDLIISISAQDNNLKLWNISNLECLLNIENIYNDGILSSGVLLNYNNKNYIIVCNFNVWESEPIKIFDFKGNKINDIKDNINDKTFFIDVYYDKQFMKNFILTGNWGYVKSYDYQKYKLYHKYCDNDKTTHYNLIVTKTQEITMLIESSRDGNIRIWNFHNALLLNKINVCKSDIRSICLWENNYIFIGLFEKLKIVDFQMGKIIKVVEFPNYTLNMIKKITHPKFGDCLVSQGLKNEQIKLIFFNGEEKN